ncbi:hypothetical protein BH23GEM3_BH23GEM3_00480 [soil metagenome]
MLQARCGLDLLQEAVGAEHSGEFGPQHLQRNLAVVLQILGKIDGGHTAFAESTLDAVSVGEGRGEVFCDFSHAVHRSACSATLRSGPGYSLVDEQLNRLGIPVQRGKVRLATETVQTSPGRSRLTVVPRVRTPRGNTRREPAPPAKRSPSAAPRRFPARDRAAIRRCRSAARRAYCRIRRRSPRPRPAGLRAAPGHPCTRRSASSKQRGCCSGSRSPGATRCGKPLA